MYPNWLQDSLPRNILNEKFLKISFSQNGEDDFVRSFFWNDILNRKIGIYLDIGCYHETLYSNTKLLNLIGWKGIGVDANPDLQSEWIFRRPDDQFYNVCIGSSDEESSALEFFRFQDGAMSTADPQRAQFLINQGWKLKDSIKVQSISLPRLAYQITQKITERINFVSIDLEMINFLPDLPEFLNLLRPQLICMECVNNDVSLANLYLSDEYENLKHVMSGAFIGGNIFACPRKDS